MYAAPWIEPTENVNAELSRSLVSRRPERLNLWETASRIVSELIGLANRVATAGFPPEIDQLPDTKTDETVRAVLVGADDKVTTDRVETAVSSGRVERTDRGLAVPLGSTWPTAANWYVLLPMLADRLDAAATDCGQLAGRLASVDAGLATPAYREITEMLESLSAVLDWFPTVVLWRHPPDGLGESDFTQIQSFLKETLVVSTTTEATE